MWEQAKKTCSKCNGAMEGGFILSQVWPSFIAAQWIEGRPERSLMGLKTRGKSRYIVCSYRSRLSHTRSEEGILG